MNVKKATFRRSELIEHHEVTIVDRVPMLVYDEPRNSVLKAGTTGIWATHIDGSIDAREVLIDHQSLRAKLGSVIADVLEDAPTFFRAVRATGPPGGVMHAVFVQ